MELWIRSQKNVELRPMLLKVNEFEIGDYDDNMNCIVVNNLYCVGIYKTKTKALEVLDDIEQRMLNSAFAEKKNGLGETLDFMPNPIYVYEMPKE